MPGADLTVDRREGGESCESLIKSTPCSKIGCLNYFKENKRHLSLSYYFHSSIALGDLDHFN